jgi:hypothetical protein
MYTPQIATRSLFFDVREGNLIEIPVIEFILLFKSYVKSLIKDHIDPYDEYYDYDVFLVRSGVREDTTFADINLDQAIHIALYLGIEKELILSNPDHFTILGSDKNTYMFNNAIFDDCNDAILHKLALIVVEILDLQAQDTAHVFIPHWMNCSITGYILEICYDPIYGPNLSLIDNDHPRRSEIEDFYRR